MAKGMRQVERYDQDGLLGLMRYLVDRAVGKVRGERIGGNVDGATARFLRDKFLKLAAPGRNVQFPFAHYAIRLPVGERIPRSRWRALCDAYLKELGYQDSHPRVYILHADAEGQHVHLVTCRTEVGGGGLYLGRNENLLATKILRGLEVRFDITRTAHSIDRSTTRLGSSDRKKRGSLTPPEGDETIEQLKRDIFDLLQWNPTFTAFVNEMNWRGNGIKGCLDKDGNLVGLVYNRGRWTQKGSQLSPKLKWASVLEAGLDYQPERDRDFLRGILPKTGDSWRMKACTDERIDYYYREMDWARSETLSVDISLKDVLTLPQAKPSRDRYAVELVETDAYLSRGKSEDMVEPADDLWVSDDV